MRLMVIGGGGREHAIIRALKKSPRAQTIYALPGNAGIAEDACCVPIQATDIPGIVSFATENRIDFAVVSPDDPLVLGAVDALQAAGIRAFGPNRAAARIEGSKVFAKDLMRKYNIPTADYRVFDSSDEALRYLQSASYPIVVKADGLALGKGVTIADDYEAAARAVTDMMNSGRFGESGRRAVIEECLSGPEVSVLALTDGDTLRPLASSMDHKRAFDGDKGPNTGGMGVIAPNPFYTDEVADACMRDIFLPTLRAMREEGCPFRGCLYFGLMLTKNGPKVIEYNCRFGDPEAQAVLELMDGDLLTAMEAAADGDLSKVNIERLPGASCCVMAVSGGYPGSYARGCAIHIGDMPHGVHVYHSGTAYANHQWVTAGGRVLGVTARATTLRDAVDMAYAGIERVSFEGMTCRRDIGRAALEAHR